MSAYRAVAAIFLPHRVFRLKIKFAQKPIKKSMISTFFKQQVISEPQKLLHFPRAWAQVAYKLVSYKKKFIPKLLIVFYACTVVF